MLPADKGFLSLGRSLAINAKRFPDKIALAEPGCSVSYHELNKKVNQLAYGLRDLGVRKGDHVGVLFGNTVEHLQILYAVAKIGGVSVVLDIKWKSKEISRAISFFDCDVLFFDSAHCPNIASETVQALRFGAFCGGNRSTFPRIEELMIGRPETELDCDLRDEDRFMIMLTSGTTGTPKGCVINHKTYAIHCLTSFIARGIDGDSRELALVPIYYNSGRETVLAHLFFGGTVYLRHQYDPKETMELIQREKISSLALAPTMCGKLLELPDLASYRTESIRHLRKAGSPFTRKMAEELIKYITPNIYQAYASTDTGLVTQLRPHEQLAKLGSSGRPVWGMEVEVIDQNHNSTPAGCEGEIRVRGPQLCQGYYKNPEEENKSFLEGWYYTGDIGRFDSEGYLYVVGRRKDVIKTGSINVAPKEIEEVLLSHPQIEDATVSGVPDLVWGEAVKAYIVLKKGATLSKEDIVAYCKSNLAGYKVPKVVEFISELSRTPLGKLATGSLPERKNGGPE